MLHFARIYVHKLNLTNTFHIWPPVHSWVGLTDFYCSTFSCVLFVLFSQINFTLRPCVFSTVKLFKYSGRDKTSLLQDNRLLPGRVMAVKYGIKCMLDLLYLVGYSHFTCAVYSSIISSFTKQKCRWCRKLELPDVDVSVPNETG